MTLRMRACTSVSLITTFLATAHSAAIVRHSTPFSAAEITAEEAFPLTGPQALRNVFLKYGASPPTSEILVPRAPPQGSVTATPSPGDALYYIPVAVGSPTATAYTLSLDTASSDFDLYAPNLGKAGSIITTTVNIGGVVVNKQRVTLVSDSTGGSSEIGMSYSGQTWYINAVSQGMPAVFAANLKKGVPGTYTLGYIDASLYTEAITYVPAVTTNGLWQFNSNGYAVGSGSFISATINAVVDTGTTLILLPQSIVAVYYNQVSGATYSNTQGGYIFPCTASLPKLVLGCGTYKATVPGSFLNYAPLSTGSATCFGGLQSDTGIGFSILGLIFIKSQFVVFKGTASPILGFATKA